MQTLTNSANYGATLSEAHDHIRNREPFHTGTLSGAWESNYHYAVRSYGVVIADWHGASNEASEISILPTAYNFSRTTSKHANIVKMAWGLN